MQLLIPTLLLLTRAAGVAAQSACKDIGTSFLVYTGNGNEQKSVGCEWITQNNVEIRRANKCTSGSTIATNCYVSCGFCGDCYDDPDFTFKALGHLDTANQLIDVDCAWLKEDGITATQEANRYNNHCDKKPEVMNNCSASCGQCVSSGNNRDVNIGAGGSGAGAGAGGTKKSKTPTVKGTKSPTVKGTKSPTVKGTKSPSVKGTKSPSVKGTKSPSVKGTKSPSVKGTKSPSVKGTKSPKVSGGATATASASNGASLTETTSPTAVYVPPVATLVGLSAIGLAFLFWRRSRRSSAQEVPIAEATPMVVEKSDVVFPISSNSMGNEFEVNGI